MKILIQSIRIFLLLSVVSLTADHGRYVSVRLVNQNGTIVHSIDPTKRLSHKDKKIVDYIFTGGLTHVIDLSNKYVSPSAQFAHDLLQLNYKNSCGDMMLQTKDCRKIKNLIEMFEFYQYVMPRLKQSVLNDLSEERKKIPAECIDTEVNVVFGFTIPQESKSHALDNTKREDASPSSTTSDVPPSDSQAV